MDQISLAISVISLLMSVLALIIAVWHNLKSYTPIITILHNRSNINGEISVVLQNKGIGPATITRIEFLLDGKSIGNDLNKIVNILESKGAEFSFFFQERDLGSVLSAGESFTPMRLVFKDKKLPDDAVNLFDRLSTRIWYKSLYGLEYRRRTR